MRMFTYVALATEKAFLAYCLAVYDYAASEPNQLSISAFDVIGILNKSGDSRGWWKGYLNGAVSISFETENIFKMCLTSYCEKRQLYTFVIGEL